MKPGTVISAPLTLDKYSEYFNHTTPIPPEQFMEAVMLQGAAKLNENHGKLFPLSLIKDKVCWAARLGYKEESKCYYIQDHLRLYIDLLLNYINPRSVQEPTFKCLEDTLTKSEVFQKQLAKAVNKKSGRILNSVQSEVCDFLTHSRDTCYRLSELPGIYLHSLLNHECSIEVESAPYNEVVRQAIQQLDNVLPAFYPLYVHSTWFNAVKKNNLIDWNENHQAYALGDRLMIVDNTAPCEVEPLVSHIVGKSLTPLQVKWILDRTQEKFKRESTNVVTVDRTGDKFVPGITHFTMENLFDTLCEIGNPECGHQDPCSLVTLVLHKVVFDRIDRCSCIDRTANGVFLQGIPVKYTTNKNLCKEPGIYESRIFYKEKLRAVLLTREY